VADEAAATELPYGDGLEPALHRVLRARPPRQALEWVVNAVSGRAVVRVQPLAGGTSSAVHRLTVEGKSGALTDVVLRRYVLDWVRDEPDAPSNEARVLGLLRDTAVPAPRLLAADPHGTLTGTPAVLMSALSGRVVWRPSDVEAWLRRLVEGLVAIHDVPTGRRLGEYVPYQPTARLVPPPWTQHANAWEAALDAYAHPPSGSDSVLLHRDFHPGNVLWSGGEISGVVDWVSSCVGPPEADVAHCRYNLAVVAGDPAAADRFLALWQQATGTSGYDHAWDLVTIVSLVGPTYDPALDSYAASAAHS